MCGISAIVGKKLDIKKYNTADMLLALKQRGPDGVGEKLYSDCWIGHRRLSIVDIENGSQPMIDGSLIISFNGEIYNFPELRLQLRRRIHISD